MNRTYKDIIDLDADTLRMILIDLKIEHLLANPELLRQYLEDSLERTFACSTYSRRGLIDQLYYDGYWA